MSIAHVLTVFDSLFEHSHDLLSKLEVEYGPIYHVRDDKKIRFRSVFRERGQ